MSKIINLSLIALAQAHHDHAAIIASEGIFTYRDLLDASARVASCFLNGEDDLREKRVAFLIPPGFHYAATQWGIWRAGGIAVPLCVFHPQPELQYIIDDSRASIVVAHPDFAKVLRPIAETRGLRFLLNSQTLSQTKVALPQIDAQRRAMIIYTSGTTSKPKGVVATHKNIQAQVTALVSAWEWTANDHVLHVLPLHHIHGIINSLTCALWAGAKCEILPKFDAEEVWRRFAAGNVTLFMAVPTIYVKLIEAWEAASPAQQKIMSEACVRMRLMVSGSAALPIHVLEKWQEITNHVLLERYGMTEIGMALSNPLHGQRVPGCVGAPLPNVEVKRVDENGNAVAPGTPGEILIKGPGVFLEYWGKPDATKRAFRDGWFCTGDIAMVENGVYRILGRSSVDIIKTGGYKVSALDIEEVLRTHPQIKECAVIGIADETWGERVAAALMLKPGCVMTLDALRSWAKERLAAYKIPSRILVLDELPRNAMGKVQKPQVTKLFKRT
ncbi:acyl-CoA synthetase [candidate division KSB1 bacterium]|nr:acyl-CoA synthetase [candidate division KSB1 bacterium]